MTLRTRLAALGWSQRIGLDLGRYRGWYPYPLACLNVRTALCVQYAKDESPAVKPMGRCDRRWVT